MNAAHEQIPDKHKKRTCFYYNQGIFVLERYQGDENFESTLLLVILGISVVNGYFTNRFAE